MSFTTATEFIKNFGRHNIAAQREPIAVTSHGRVTGYYVSAHEFEDLQKIKASMRRSFTLDTMPEELYQAILKSKVDPQYDYLNDILPAKPKRKKPSK